jgi:hypothetical protein
MENMYNNFKKRDKTCILLEVEIPADRSAVK